MTPTRKQAQKTLLALQQHRLNTVGDARALHIPTATLEMARPEIAEVGAEPLHDFRRMMRQPRGDAEDLGRIVQPLDVVLRFDDERVSRDAQQFGIAAQVNLLRGKNRIENPVLLRQQRVERLLAPREHFPAEGEAHGVVAQVREDVAPQRPLCFGYACIAAGGFHLCGNIKHR